LDKIIINLIALCLVLLVFAGATALSIATLIHGYGLTVTSWGWVIGGAIGQLILIGIMQAIGNIAKALTD